MDHAAMLLNTYEPTINMPATRRHCVQGLRSVLLTLGPQEREHVLRGMQAIDGKHWRSVLGQSHQRSNHWIESVLGTAAGPLTKAEGFVEGVWLAGGVGLVASGEYLFGAPDHWTRQFVKGLTDGLVRSSLPHDWMSQVGGTLASGVLIGPVVKWAVDGAALPARDAAARDLLFTPRLDSEGFDRTPEVTDVVFQLLAMVTDLEKRKGLSLKLVCSMAIDAHLSRAFADFAGSRDPALRNAALDVIGANESLEQHMTEAGPFTLSEGWGLFQLGERYRQTELAMDELWPPENNEQRRPSLNEPQARAAVTHWLGGQEPILSNEGIFHAVRDKLPDFYKTISPPNVLTACLKEIAAAPGRLDGIISSLRDQLSAQD